MPTAAPLVEMRRAWPWGLVVLRAAHTRDGLPLSLGRARVVSSSSEIAAIILHAVDGEATAQVWLGAGPDGLTEVHMRELIVPTGELVMGDAAGGQTIRATVPPGRWQARVLMNDVTAPELVAFVLDPGRGGIGAHGV